MGDVDLPAAPGVYVLRFPAGHVYVGATWDLGHRIINHLRKLRAGTHPNARLQSAWASCSGVDVRVSWRPLPGVDAFQLCEYETRLLNHWVGVVGWAWMLNTAAAPVPFTPQGKPARRPESSAAVAGVVDRRRRA